MFTVDRARVAYFSMEICLEEAIPTYSGGLGVLAGDTLRAAADLEVPMSAITLLYRKGYFRQQLDELGNQSEGPVEWRPEDHLEQLPVSVTVSVAGRDVIVRAWRYVIRGATGHEVPVYLLDTNDAANSEWDRTLTDVLYGGDSHYRLCQETILGVGGVEILRALGFGDDVTYHMNEGHSALLTLPLLERQLGRRTRFDMNEADVQAIRQGCVFTTHTPVPAGHDRFTMDEVRHVLGSERAALLEASGVGHGELNMTKLAIRFAHFVNGVAMKHAEVSRTMFPEVSVRSVTNGVHGVTWAAQPFLELFDRHFPEWRRDNMYLRYAIGIPLWEIQQAHERAKRDLFVELQRRTGVQLDPKVMTVGFARRATPYKQADLIFHELEWLRVIARRAGPLQIVYGGKAHPADVEGKALIRRIYDAAAQLADDIKIVYVENYEMTLGRLLTSGVDVWLNNPKRPMEASGTSGMKAALNGGLNLSVLDGWWAEAYDGTNGWAIPGEVDSDPAAQDERDAETLHELLGAQVLPAFYERDERGLPGAWMTMMRASLRSLAPRFSATRMVAEYLDGPYRG